MRTNAIHSLGQCVVILSPAVQNAPAV